MQRVAIVGGGIAGVGSALALRGSDLLVDLFEKGDLVGLDWSLYPYVLSSGAEGRSLRGLLQIAAARELSSDARVRLRLRHEVKALLRHGGKFRVKYEGPGGEGVEEYDKVILATGALAEREPLGGKQHIYYGDLLSDIERFISARNSFRRIALRGVSAASLAAALALRGAGFKSIHIGERPPLKGLIDGELSRLIEGECTAQGLDLYEPRLEFRVLGAARVEAVQVDDRIIACDCVVDFPRYRPNADLARGLQLKVGTRGIMVDAGMRTSLPGVWAAGRCICLEGGPRSLYSPSFSYVTGFIAGLQAGGVQEDPLPASLEPVEAWRLGRLELALCGMELRGRGGTVRRRFALRAALGALRAEGVAFAKAGFLRRVELVGAEASAWARWFALLISRGATLDELERCEWGHLPERTSIPLLTWAGGQEER